MTSRTLTISEARTLALLRGAPMWTECHSNERWIVVETSIRGIAHHEILSCEALNSLLAAGLVERSKTSVKNWRAL